MTTTWETMIVVRGCMAMKFREIVEAMKIVMIKTWADLRVSGLGEKMRGMMCLVLMVNLEMM